MHHISFRKHNKKEEKKRVEGRFYHQLLFYSRKHLNGASSVLGGLHIVRRHGGRHVSHT